MNAQTITAIGAGLRAAAPVALPVVFRQAAE
jgi:hypothetical protein